MSDIKISVIVPIHGVGKYLPKCLDSLAKQDFLWPYEVICVSDSANDNSPEIIDDYIKAYPNKFVRLDVKNRNLSFTRNDGLSIAKGDYVAFVDGDDFVAGNYLSTFYNTAIEKDADVVIGNYYIYDNGKRYKHGLSFISYKGYIKAKNAIRFMNNDLIIRGYVWYKFFKRSVIQNVKFPSIKYMLEDITFSTMAFLNSKKIYWMQKRTYYYVIHKDSISLTWEFYDSTQNALNALGFCKVYAASLYGNEKAGKIYTFSSFIRKVIAFYYIYMKNDKKRDKFKINMEVEKEIKIIKKHVCYKNTPWEKAVIDAGLDKLVKEDISLNKDEMINLKKFCKDYDKDASN
ncbi:MAG: glycosyltransferase [Bacilli bacterium]|jgi:glycosyltransferase EpsH